MYGSAVIYVYLYMYGSDEIYLDLNPPAEVWLCFKLCDGLSERNDQLLPQDWAERTRLLSEFQNTSFLYFYLSQMYLK